MNTTEGSPEARFREQVGEEIARLGIDRRRSCSPAPLLDDDQARAQFLQRVRDEVIAMQVFGFGYDYEDTRPACERTMFSVIEKWGGARMSNLALAKCSACSAFRPIVLRADTDLTLVERGDVIAPYNLRHCPRVAAPSSTGASACPGGGARESKPAGDFVGTD